MNDDLRNAIQRHGAAGFELESLTEDTATLARGSLLYNTAIFALALLNAAKVGALIISLSWNSLGYQRLAFGD